VSPPFENHRDLNVRARRCGPFPGDVTGSCRYTLRSLGLGLGEGLVTVHGPRAHRTNKDRARVDPRIPLTFSALRLFSRSIGRP